MLNKTIRVDKGLQSSQLSEKYDRVGEWGEHPVFTAELWRQEVFAMETRRGYWDWVACKIEAAVRGKK